MADRLYNEMMHGRVEGEFEESFIPRVRDKVYQDRALTEKEIAKLEELFERY